MRGRQRLKSANYEKEVGERQDGLVERKKTEEEKERPYGVGMQHSEEVGAREELGAGGLKQQGEARPGTGLSHTVVPTQLCNTHRVRLRLQDIALKTTQTRMQCSETITRDGGVHVSLVRRQFVGWLLLWSAVIGYRPTYTLIPGKVCVCVNNYCNDN